MAFQIKKNETLSHGARRITNEQIQKAQTCIKLASQGSSPKQNVHEVRKSLKKLRAVLRLFRNDLSKKRYSYAYSRYRDLGQHLAEVRDADVMRETLKKIYQLNKRHVQRSVFTEAQLYLDNRSKSISRKALKKKKIQKYKCHLLKLESAASKTPWKTLSHDWKTLNRGLKPLYKQGAKDFQSAKQHPSLVHFHEWRKSVKQLWYSLRLLTPLRPTLLRPLDSKLEKIESCLGEDHDLGVLDEVLNSEFKDDDDHLKTILLLIQRRQNALRKQALKWGEEFYKDKPAAFTKHLRPCWDPS